MERKTSCSFAGCGLPGRNGRDGSQEHQAELVNEPLPGRRACAPRNAGRPSVRVTALPEPVLQGAIEETPGLVAIGTAARASLSRRAKQRARFPRAARLSPTKKANGRNAKLKRRHLALQRVHGQTIGAATLFF